MSKLIVNDMIRDEGWRRKVLAYDPNAGGKGDFDIRLIRDEIKKARKIGVCVDCGEPIRKGTLTRVQTGVDGERIVSIRTCQDCCDAMAIWEEDFGEALIARYMIRFTTRREECYTQR